MSVDAKLQKLVTHAYANAPAVTERFDAAGVSPDDIQTIADLEKLPILSKDTVVQMQQDNPPFGGLLAVPMSEVRHVFFSPGPLYEPDAGDDDSLLATATASMQRAGFTPGDIVINTLSYHLVPAGLLFDYALTALGCTVLPSGVGNVELQLKMMRDFNVNAYAGTPSYLMSLIKKAEEMGLDFKRDFNVSKAFVSAEPLPPALRTTLVNDYGISVGNAYATAELGVLAINTDGGMAMQLFDEPIVEILDPETGQPVETGAPGEVVVTNFNRAYPLIRLGTGDMAINIDPAPGNSQQAQRAITLIGRSGEAVKVRGMFVHPNQLRFVAGQMPGVVGVQGVVTRPADRDYFNVRIALAPDANADTFPTDMLKEQLRSICRVKIDDVTFVDAIDAGERGMVDGRDWQAL